MADDVGAVHVVGGQIGQRAVSAVFVFDPHRPSPGSGGGAGMDAAACLHAGFLICAETWSSSPSGSPSKRRPYRSSTWAALTAKSGSRGKIQDRCCHGSSASPASQRRTVDADTEAPMPRRAASDANSGQDHFASGVSLSPGRSHANAFTSATTEAANARGRPVRGKSRTPSRPCSQKRRRHLRTVSTVTARSRAIAAFAAPSAAASTIRARSTSRCSPLTRRARASSSRRCPSVSTIRCGLITGMGTVVPHRPPGTVPTR